MKKIVSILLILVLLLGVCSCTPNDDTGELGQKENTESGDVTQNGGEVEIGGESEIGGEAQTGGDSTIIPDNTNPDDSVSSGDIESSVTPPSNDTPSADDPVSSTPTTPDSNTPSNDGAQTEDGNIGEGGSDSNEGSGSEDTPSFAPAFDPSVYTYRDYQNMSGYEQESFFNKFESTKAFFDWLNDAKAKDKELNPDKEIGADGTIELD